MFLFEQCISQEFLKKLFLFFFSFLKQESVFFTIARITELSEQQEVGLNYCLLNLFTINLQKGIKNIYLKTHDRITKTKIKDW